MTGFWAGFLTIIVILGIVGWVLLWILLIADERIPPWVGITALVLTFVLGVSITGGIAASNQY